MEKKSAPIRLTAEPRDRFFPRKRNVKSRKKRAKKSFTKRYKEFYRALGRRLRKGRRHFWDGKFAQLLLAPIIAASLVAAPTLLLQATIDNGRSTRESAREDTRADEAIRATNLMFVRDRSEDGANKPYSYMDLKGLNISGLNFRGANLRFADLNGANIEESDFSSVGQRRADLYKVDLRTRRGDSTVFNDTDMHFATMDDSSFAIAKFKGSDLRFATLKRSCLTGTDFSDSADRRTDLRNAEFDGSNLSGADFQGARLDGASFSGANLSNTTGLTKEAIEVTFYDDDTIWPWELDSGSFQEVCEIYSVVNSQDNH